MGVSGCGLSRFSNLESWQLCNWLTKDNINRFVGWSTIEDTLMNFRCVEMSVDHCKCIGYAGTSDTFTSTYNTCTKLIH